MNLTQAFAMGSVLVDGLKLVEKMLDDGAFQAAKAAIGALLHGADGKQTPQEILARVEALHADLAKNDSAGTITSSPSSSPRMVDTFTNSMSVTVASTS